MAGVRRSARCYRFGRPDHLASWHARSTHDLVPHRFRRLVAICRHVPGLPTQLRRWGRRRRRDIASVAACRTSGVSVDAIWLNPWYPSPMADAGYDIADYRAIDPLFGTLAEAEAFIAEAGLARPARHRAESHVERAPVVSSRACDRTGVPRAGALLFRPGRGDGTQPPNDWEMVRLDADPRARREAGGVVPAPLRPRAAGPELD